MGIFLINLVSAVSLGTFEENETVKLIQTCNNCTYCNLTAIKYPNGSNILTNQNMTQDETYYSYNLLSNYTNITGIYKYCYDCGNIVDKATGCIDFEITPTGRDISSAQGLTISASIVLLVIASLFFFAFLFSKKDIFRWSFFLFSILFLVMTINISSIELSNSIGSQNIKNIFDKIGAVCYYMYWFVFGLVFIIWSFGIIMTIGDKWKMKKAREVGQPIDFDKL
jgi:hypothetical protein